MTVIMDDLCQIAACGSSGSLQTRPRAIFRPARAYYEKGTEMPMPRFEQVDQSVNMRAQMESTEEGPVVLLNIFSVAEDDVQAMLDNWKRDGEIMKRQSGFISTQLHQGVAANIFVNYAVWESMAHYRAAFQNPEFQEAITGYPASVVTRPMLLKKISVPNLCAA